MFDWVTKKDLTYWVIFSALLWLLSSDFGDGDQALLDNWAFASTIVSIILAVLAIVYSYYQGFTAVDTTRKMEESAKKIVKVSDQLENKSLDKFFKDIENKIESLNHTLDERLDAKFTGFKELLNNDSQEYKGEIRNFYSKEEWKSLLHFHKDSNMLFIDFIILLCYEAYKQRVKLEFIELSHWIYKDKEPEPGVTEVQAGILSGFAMAFQYLGILIVEGNGVMEIEVLDFSSGLAEALEECIVDAEKINSKVLDGVTNFINDQVKNQI
jgi:hypothetical protein